MLLQDKTRQRRGNTIAFSVVFILILAVMLWLFLM